MTIRLPGAGPTWLPDYTRAIEREIERTIREWWGQTRVVSEGFSLTVNGGERIYLITASGLSVALPSAVNNSTKLVFKLMVPGTFTLNAAAGEGIDDDASLSLTSQYEAVTLFSDGEQWVVLMAYAPTAATAQALSEIAEAAEYQEVTGRATVHLLAQLVALARGKNDPMPSDEGDTLIKQFSHKEDM